MTKTEQIVEEIKKGERFTKVELANKLGFNPTTVKNILDDLRNQNVIITVAKRPTGKRGTPNSIYQYVGVIEPIKPEVIEPEDEEVEEVNLDENVSSIIDKVKEKNEKILSLTVELENEKMCKAKALASLSREHYQEVEGLRQRNHLLNDRCHSLSEEISILQSKLDQANKELQDMKDKVDGYRKMDALIKSVAAYRTSS